MNYELRIMNYELEKSGVQSYKINLIFLKSIAKIER